MFQLTELPAIVEVQRRSVLSSLAASFSRCISSRIYLLIRKNQNNLLYYCYRQYLIDFLHNE